MKIKGYEGICRICFCPVETGAGKQTKKGTVHIKCAEKGKGDE